METLRERNRADDEPPVHVQRVSGLLRRAVLIRLGSGVHTRRGKPGELQK